LSDCTTHCSGCTFGNSPVVCNRCGIQIVHRQVEEHAQTCSVSVVCIHLYVSFMYWWKAGSYAC
jgi:hypothetical protein